MKRIKILKFIFVFGAVLMLNGILVFAQDNSARIKLWDVNTMPMGVINSYDGLTIIQADKGSTQVEVSSLSGKRYKELYFTKCINTNGDADIATTFVPYNRAVKFTTNEPCALVMYGFNKSKQSKDVKAVVSRKGVVEAKFTLKQSNIDRYFVYLENPGDYYIYCDTGSLGISRIELNKIVKGDLNGDGKVTEEDVVILLRSFNNMLTLSSMQKKNADMDNNNSIDNNDKNLILQSIKNTYGYMPQFVSNKVWNMDNLYDPSFEFLTGKYCELDGLGIIPCSGRNDIGFWSNNNKYYDLTFQRCIHLGGNAVNNMLQNCPSERAIKINVDKACYLTYYAASVSSNAETPNICVSRFNQVIKKVNLEKPGWEGSKLQKHTVYLPEPDTYYIYSGYGSESVNIYQIELTDVNSNAEEFYKTINVAKNSTYDYRLTANNVSQKNNIVYRITYDSNYLRLNKLADIEFNQSTQLPLKNETSLIQIIYSEPGVIKFKFKESVSNWSGLLSDIKFNAVNDGSTTIRFEVG